MASTSEKGHAKNIANANLLIAHISELGTAYNPNNPKLSLSNLETIYNDSFAQQSVVNTLVAPYSVAVDNREMIFAPISKKITKLRKIYKATEGVTKIQLEDFMTIARKLKGVRKINHTQTTDATEEKRQHSTSQMSYDQRTNNMAMLISLLQNTPNYNPNEIEFKITELQAKKLQMLQATQQVASTFVPLNNTRAIRNDALYLSENNLVDTFNKAKDYLFAILDSNSAQYKDISKIKFKKI